MLFQRLARLLGHQALHWFYRVDPPIGHELIPPFGPLLIVSNHPNQLVDVLACAEIIGSDMALTGKATLFQNPLMRFMLTHLGALPLVRRQDAPTADINNNLSNQNSFEAIHTYWRHGGPVLIFPEGKSYTHPHLAPLKTGAARLALSARDEAGIKNLKIVPIGLRYEKKWSARSRLGIAVAPLIDIDSFQGRLADPDSVRDLTSLITDRLASATLNFASGSEAKVVLFTAEFLAEQERPIITLDTPPTPWSLIAQKVAWLKRLQNTSPEAYQDILSTAGALRARLKDAKLATEHLQLSLSIWPALRFVLRALPFLAWYLIITSLSRLIHAPAFYLAKYFSRHRQDNSDPAMNTIIAASLLTLLTYVFYLALTLWLGFPYLAILVLTFPALGYLDLVGRDHFRRLVARSRTWWRLRSRPALQANLLARAEALATLTRSSKS